MCTATNPNKNLHPGKLKTHVKNIFRDVFPIAKRKTDKDLETLAVLAYVSYMSLAEL